MSRRNSLCTALSCLALGLIALLARPPQSWAEAPDSWDLCAAYIAEAERALRLPAHLLQAIAKVESGRWNAARSALSAWPWTVMAEGKGRYLPNKAAAIAEVKALKAKGVRNIDVGCMQINLHFHPKAFDDLEQAFDPAQNVAYGATFLRQLRQDSRSWTRAIGRYHSNTPALSGRYRLKVFRAWRAEKRLANQRRRDAIAQQAQAARAAAATPLSDQVGQAGEVSEK